jgi:L-aspartate oxidase
MRAPVLVIGSGVAGLTYVLKVADRFPVALVTKKEHTESNTNYAQGGIAAVMTPEDASELHVRDTLVAGADLCHLDAVEQMVREGPDRVRELIARGAHFSTEPAPGGGERLALGMEGGHSQRRIVHAKDLTGREVERTLVTAVQQHPNITVYEHHAAVDLLVEPPAAPGRRPSLRTPGEPEPAAVGSPPPPATVRGATVIDSRTGVVETFPAAVTVLATGGCGEVYLHTTNPSIATGDGVAMAYRAGAAIANMEFIQFHPTTLYHPDARSFLISEAVRGEGGILRLRDGTSFMEKYHPLASLAPRDVVARAIDAEMKASGDDFVYLDLTHLKPELVRTRFPNIYRRCLEHGIDITRAPIPIVPAAHYSCGGVLTDLHARTTLAGLFAVGEVACTGVHGANRLASNSLLEALVFADRAASETVRLLDEAPGPAVLPETEPARLSENDPQRVARDVSPEFVAQLRQLVQTLMWTHVGIVRSDRRLAQALREISLLGGAVESLFNASRVTPELLELRNITLVAQLIIECALQRKESRGLHFNVDHPEPVAVWRRDTVIP